MKHRSGVVQLLLTLALILSTALTVSAHTSIWNSESGGMQSGPLGLNGQPAVYGAGEKPVAMQIADADVDADVETRTAQNGIMQDPTGPWVISWYDFSALVGSAGNAVFAGHVDYWGVGPAVLRDVADLGPGAEIVIIGESGARYIYEVETVERVNVYELTPEDLQQIVGPSVHPTVTIITCGGEFNGQEYLQRDVVRASLNRIETPEQIAAEATEVAEQSDSDLFAIGDTAVVTGASVNVRSEPSINSEVVSRVVAGELVTITGGAVAAEQYIWWPIMKSDGTEGWIAESLLAPAG